MAEARDCTCLTLVEQDRIGVAVKFAAGAAGSPPLCFQAWSYRRALLIGPADMSTAVTDCQSISWRAGGVSQVIDAMSQYLRQ